MSLNEKQINARLNALKRPSSAQRSPDERIPAGQQRVDHLPILDLGQRPAIDTAAWQLRLFGAIAAPQQIDWQRLQQLPQTRVTADIHCVTRWSRLDVAWQGVAAREIVALAQPDAAARFITLHGADGYTTNLPLDALLAEDVLIAHTLEGQPLDRSHGGPVRLVVPSRYFWKSAKWLVAIEFHHEDRPGFWEQRGYHNNADPWQEERFG
jgi:DMSO/TMAO reductase YedYZ molybdopterin-dependent catalytic subunit